MLQSARMVGVSLGIALTAACGGGQGSMSQAPSSASPVTVVGTVSGTPSALQFNQQPLNTASAQVTVNGQPGSITDLQPGVVLHGKGTETGTAIELASADVRPDLCGPVTAVDVAGGHLTVLGTVVTVDALTVLVEDGPEGTTTTLALADFKVGDVVRVFGTVQTDGSILATRVERRAPGTAGDEEMRGVVSGLDATAHTFMLGSITVAYGTATVQGTLANGVGVEVGGTLAGTTFTATRVEVQDATEDAPGSTMDLSGPVSGLDTAAKTFTLMAFKVDYSAAKVEGALANGAMVEVEGSLSTAAPGTLLATQVEVRFDQPGGGASDEEVKGAITALSPSALTLTVGGATYWTDAQTVFIRDDAAIAFSDLKVGDWVEVRALSTQTNAAGEPYATRVAEESTGEGDMAMGLSLRGILSAFDPVGQTFTVGGTPVVVTSTTTFIQGMTVLSPATFWGTDRTGAQVEVEGTASASAFTAVTVHLLQD